MLESAADAQEAHLFLELVAAVLADAPLDLGGEGEDVGRRGALEGDEEVGVLLAHRARPTVSPLSPASSMRRAAGSSREGFLK